MVLLALHLCDDLGGVHVKNDNLRLTLDRHVRLIYELEVYVGSKRGAHDCLTWSSLLVIFKVCDIGESDSEQISINNHVDISINLGALPHLRRRIVDGSPLALQHVLFLRVKRIDIPYVLNNTSVSLIEC